jgi:hypothetical protein
MSPPGRPKGEEHRSAQREGTPMSPPGCLKGEEQRSANHEATPKHLPGFPRASTGVRSAKAFQ